MARLEGDILILGAGGKMGPSLALLAKRAIGQLDEKKEVICVSRFSDKEQKKFLENHRSEERRVGRERRARWEASARKREKTKPSTSRMTASPRHTNTTTLVETLT